MAFHFVIEPGLRSVHNVPLGFSGILKDRAIYPVILAPSTASSFFVWQSHRDEFNNIHTIASRPQARRNFLFTVLSSWKKKKNLNQQGTANDNAANVGSTKDLISQKNEVA